eukprot:70675_1
MADHVPKTTINDNNQSPKHHRKPQPSRSTNKSFENMNNQQNHQSFQSDHYKSFKKRTNHTTSTRRSSPGRGVGQIKYKRNINKKLHYYTNNKYHLNENIDINYEQDINDPIYNTEIFKGMKFDKLANPISYNPFIDSTKPNSNQNQYKSGD